MAWVCVIGVLVANAFLEGRGDAGMPGRLDSARSAKAKAELTILFPLVVLLVIVGSNAVTNTKGFLKGIYKCFHI